MQKLPEQVSMYNVCKLQESSKFVIMVLHYIFMLWFVLLSSFFLLLFFPRLISAVGDWMFTILWHMVWP